MTKICANTPQGTICYDDRRRNSYPHSRYGYGGNSGGLGGRAITGDDIRRRHRDAQEREYQREQYRQDGRGYDYDRRYDPVPSPYYAPEVRRGAAGGVTGEEIRRVVLSDGEVTLQELDLMLRSGGIRPNELRELAQDARDGRLDNLQAVLGAPLVALPRENADDVAAKAAQMVMNYSRGR